VLSIDDDGAIAGSFRQHLTMQSCDVHVAVDPESAGAARRAGALDSIAVFPRSAGTSFVNQFVLPACNRGTTLSEPSSIKGRP
jgi:DNA-binding NtrC family response regulator